MNFDPIRIRNLILIFILVLIFGGLGFLSYIRIKADRFDAQHHIDSEQRNTYVQPTFQYGKPSASPSASVAMPTTSPTVKTSAVLPPKVLIDVPFLVQAPNGNWDEIHKEACEEASLIMVKYFMAREPLTIENGDPEIVNFVTWQTENGYEYDITVTELKQAAAEYYKLATGRVETNFTINDIKSELAAGRPVIIPVAGQRLPNPYFRSPGPPYHMLVIKGYDEQGFITNDPGTRQGKDFRYNYTDLFNAIHDWNGSTTTIESGPKAYLVFD